MKYTEEIKYLKELLRDSVVKIDITGPIRLYPDYCGQIDLIVQRSKFALEDWLRSMKLKRQIQVLKNGTVIKSFIHKNIQVPINLHIVNKDNFGVLQLIITGTPKFYTGIFKALKQNGYYYGMDICHKSNKGELYNEYLRKNGCIISIPEEENLFKLINIDFINPKERI